LSVYVLGSHPAPITSRLLTLLQDEKT